MVRTYSLGMVAATVLLPCAMSTTECDWKGSRFLTGKNSGETTMWSCWDNALWMVNSVDELESSANEVSAAQRTAMTSKLTADSQTPCNWEGDISYSGNNDCDDYVFSCYDQNFYGVRLVGHRTGTATGCGDVWDCPAQSAAPLASCNFNQPLSTGGHLTFRCIDGILASVGSDYAFSSKLELAGEQQAKAKAEAEAEAEAEVLTAESSSCWSWGTAVGSWEFVASENAPFTVEVTYGTETSDTISTEWAQSLMYSMEAGIEFLDVSVSTEVSVSITQSIESTLTQSYGVTFSFGCDRGQLWQWVLKSGRPWESESAWSTVVSSQIMWCTLDSYEAPKCPPTVCDCGDDCSTSDCQTCEPYEGDHGSSISFTPPTCDWTGKRRLSGGKDNDDYYFNCENNFMTSISNANSLYASESCSTCDWEGVRHMAGTNDDDDLYLECCGSTQAIVGIWARDGVVKPHQPGDSSSGIPCQWEGTRRASGAKSGDDFYLICSGGLLVEMRAIPELSLV